MEIPSEQGARLQKMFVGIEGWQARVELDPLVPAEHSSLAADDKAFPLMPTSQVAYNGILGAVEHLHLFRTTFMATRLLYPAAYYTVLRSALMGAAQAVWVLAGPRPNRLDHALRIFIDDVNQKRKLINDLGDLTDEQQAHADRDRAKLAARLDEAATAATGLGMTFRDITSYKLDMTTVIKEAISLANPQNTVEAAAIRSGAGLLWRMTSGHAHGTPSSRLNLIRFDDVVRRPDGSAFAKPDSPIEYISGAAAAATLLTNEAWRLYDLRCQPSTTV
jgi:hypothetical protein